VALTAHALQDHKDQAEEAGCDGFLTKPFKKNELIESILKFSKVEENTEKMNIEHRTSNVQH
jgi:CheY-like chemotaxis protein